MSNALIGTVYLLHFDERISDGHTTQHYLGFADSLEGRMADHAAGRGARLTEVARERNIGWVVSRIWPDRDRTFERALKERKDGPRLCPLCTKRPKGGVVETPAALIRVSFEGGE